MDTGQRSTLFSTIWSDVARHLSEVETQRLHAAPWLYDSRKVRSEPGSDAFSRIVHSLNADLELGFGSAVSLNFDPNLGSVLVGSGSNAVQNRTSASLLVPVMILILFALV